MARTDSRCVEGVSDNLMGLDPGGRQAGAGLGQPLRRLGGRGQKTGTSLT